MRCAAARPRSVTTSRLPNNQSARAADSNLLQGLCHLNLDGYVNAYLKALRLTHRKRKAFPFYLAIERTDMLAITPLGQAGIYRMIGLHAAMPNLQYLNHLLACCHGDLSRHTVLLAPDQPAGSQSSEATSQHK